MENPNIKKGVGAPLKSATGWKEDYKIGSITYSIIMPIRQL